MAKPQLFHYRTKGLFERNWSQEKTMKYTGTTGSFINYIQWLSPSIKDVDVIRVEPV